MDNQKSAPPLPPFRADGQVFDNNHQGALNAGGSSGAKDHKPQTTRLDKRRASSKSPLRFILSTVSVFLVALSIIAGLALTPYIARKAIVSSLVCAPALVYQPLMTCEYVCFQMFVYERIVVEAAEIVGQGVIARISDAVATNQLASSFMESGAMCLCLIYFSLIPWVACTL